MLERALDCLGGQIPGLRHQVERVDLGRGRGVKHLRADVEDRHSCRRNEGAGGRGGYKG